MATPTHRTKRTKAGNNGNGHSSRRRSRPLSSSSLRSLSSSVLVDRASFADSAGLTFEGKRNVSRLLGYPDELTPHDYRRRYERGDIASRICEIYPDSTWSLEPRIVEDPDPDVETPFEAEILTLAGRLSLWSELWKADILGSIFRYSALIIGAEGDYSEELQPGSPDSIAFLRSYGEDKAQIGVRDRDPLSPRFGQALFYNVVMGEGAGKSVTKRVHWSRVIHVTGGVSLESKLYATPSLKPIWNRLLDLEKVLGGGSEAAWIRANPGLQVDVPFRTDSNGYPIKIDEESLDDLEEQADEYIHGFRRLLFTRDTRLNQLSSQVHGFGPNADALLTIICSTIGVPKRILLGSERGELASSQDRTNFASRVQARRKLYANPLIREVISRFGQYGYISSVPESWSISWPTIDETTEDEKATSASSYASANSILVSAGMEPLVSSAEIRSRVLGLEDPLPEDIEYGITPRGLRAAADNASEDSSESTWNTAHTVAENGEEAFGSIITEMYLSAASAIDTSDIERELSSGDVDGAEDIIDAYISDAEEQYLPKIVESTLDLIEESATLTLAEAQDRGSFYTDSSSRGQSSLPRRLQDDPLEMQFDITNPRAIEYAETQSSLLITEIGAATRSAIQALIREGLEEGIAPRELSRQVREHIGLHSKQVRAVANLDLDLRGASPGDVIERFPPRPGVRKVAGFRAKIPSGGATDKWVNQQLEKYRRMHLNYRARLIARTETMRSANAGQRELWLQAREKGLLSENSIRYWISTPDERTRDTHASMDGQEQSLDDGFESPEGNTIEPGEEPHCRCSQGIKAA